MLSVFTVFMPIVIALGFVISYRDWLDLNKSFIHRVAPGPCKYVMEEGGSEDLTYIGNSTVIISSGLGSGEGEGSMKALDLKTNEVVTMQIQEAPDRNDFMTRPHGITTWKATSGKMYVYVLTHPPSKDTVEVFELKTNNVLQYKRTITDPLFTLMNDLVAVGKDQFYITKFWHNSNKALRTLEYLSQIAWGGVMYYNGHKARQVVTGLLMPNGINVAKDGRMVFVAEFGRKKLLGYQRSSTNDLSKTWEMYTDTLVDNIEVDHRTGDLWIGCHPVAYRIFDSMSTGLGLTLPSQVLRFKMKDNEVTAVEEVYADDGSEIFGSSVATYVDGKLVIGSVTRQALVCDVKTLSV